MVPYRRLGYVAAREPEPPTYRPLLSMAIRRLAGLVVVLLSVLPAFRLIRLERSGPWGESTVAEAARAYDVMLWGSVLVVGVAMLVGIWARQKERSGSGEAPTLDVVRPLAIVIARIPAGRFALACGAAAFALASLVTNRVFQRLLTNVDEMTSVIHARYLAAGQWGGPVGESAEAWLIPNMLVTDVGWVSQYPPGHLLLLAGAEWAGPAWLLGPTLLGLMVAFSCLAATRLLTTRPVEARVGGVLLTLSPFLLLLGGGALSHLSAGAAISAALYFGLRARDGRAVWALGAGLATGAAVLSRPWTGIVLATTLTLGPWLHQMLLARRSSERRKGDAALVSRVAFWVLGGVPFALMFVVYNLQVFGNPFELGYEVLYGPAHKLGFHLDPWGYPYGVTEAIAYTSADLVRFGVALLDTPVPLTLVVGLTLLLAPRLPEGARTLALWALVPLAINAAYWFHQPRMLFEAAPGWVWLGVVGVGLALRSANGPVRIATATAVVVALVVGLWAFVPVRFAGNTWSEETLARITTPLAQPGEAEKIVFVHASWRERIAGRFQAAGMRNDSLQAIIRRNDMCALDRYAKVRRGVALTGSGSPLDRTLDQTQTSELRDGLNPHETQGGVRVPRLAGVAWTRDCDREFNADRFGAVSLAPLLWQGALPGLADARGSARRAAMYVRDFGPEANRVLLERFPEREAWVFAPVAPDTPPRLVPYREGMELLWGPVL